MYTASTALLDAMQEAGISYVFANLGSDHPAFVEAVAKANAEGRAIPKIITCPNEMVGLTAAQGFAQVSGVAQAVVVHVECGTQAMAGAIHNVAKGRVPVLIFAGLSPFTQEDELRGSRNEFIQWIQDVYDQRGIVREYMKYDNEFRTGKNVKQITHRALQFAYSDPKGPVYLVGAREVMEEEVDPVAIEPSRWSRVQPSALPPGAAETIVDALAGAKRPLVVTSYIGKNPKAVDELVALCGKLGIGVVESVPNCMNFPHDDVLYQGNQWNHPFQNQALADADVVLVLDSDVPWIPKVSKPSPDAQIFHIDVDPLKQSMPLWYIRAHASYQADGATALAQLNAYADTLGEIEGLEERTAHYAAAHQRRAERIAAAEVKPEGKITSEYLVACVRKAISPDAIVLNEGITNYPAICDHIAPTRPGSFFNSGGGSLGWNGGAAIGAKLAEPDREVVALTGDGSYMFTVPSSVHWMAMRYETPFLQVVFNNRGWRAPRYSALAVHPDGFASRSDDINVAFDPPPAYAEIAAAAGGAYARQVKDPNELEAVIAEALRVVREEKRSAVLDVWLDHLMEG